MNNFFQVENCHTFPKVDWTRKKNIDGAIDKEHIFLWDKYKAFGIACIRGPSGGASLLCTKTWDAELSSPQLK